MGALREAYAEIMRQYLKQSPFFCLKNSNIDINPHQVEAFVFALAALKSGGAILADEVGLGKTIEAGLVMKFLLLSGRHHRLLLIMPSNLRKQWQVELEEKFDIPSIIVDGANIDKYREVIKKEAAVIIVSYNFAARQKDMLARTAWDCCVFDEAHRMRNVHKGGAKVAGAVQELTRRIPKIMLTATPMQNSLLDLYGLVQFIDGRIFYDRRVFSERYIRNKMYDNLREQLRPVIQRSLRSEAAGYLQFPGRREITVNFSLSPAELELYMRITQYLQKAILYALPGPRRALITSVIRKLLASSSAAVAETFEALKKRLVSLRESTRMETADESLDFFFNFIEDEDLDGDGEGEPDAGELYPRERVNDFIQHEIDEVDAIIKNAAGIAHNAKMTALKKALSIAFESQKKSGIAEKAVVFTESLRTQKYIQEELAAAGYDGEILMFNGSPGDPTTNAIYRAWSYRNRNKAAGSRSVEIKNAIVEAFRDEYRILLVTDAGSEGLNLQFCNTVINYDLPWNPQKIEQRIGRCHRYGQKNDVAVINLLNTQNEADRRVYEILSGKFELFQGVFGASDRAIGLLESGNDFEKRVAQIYQECRTAEDFTWEFNSLERELDRKKGVKLWELRTLLTNMTGEEHQIEFQKILSDLERFRDDLEYWSGDETEEQQRSCPLLMRAASGLPGVPGARYLLIGSYSQGGRIVSPVCQLMGENGTFHDLSGEEIRRVLEALEDDSLSEAVPGDIPLPELTRALGDRLYQFLSGLNRDAIEQNRRKLENWVSLRREDYILQSRDTSKREELEAACEAETNFRLKIRLKKQIEELQQAAQRQQQEFHNVMSCIEAEADAMQREFEDGLMAQPQLFLRTVVRFQEALRS